MNALTDLNRRRLIAAAAASLVAVGLTWRLDDKPLDRALAGCIGLGAAAAFLATTRSRDDGVRSSLGGDRRRVVPLLLAGAMLFALVAPIAAARSVRTVRQDTPQATVRDFLSSAVVNNDGFTAASYLAPRARQSFEHHSRTGPDSELFFGYAHLTLGGLRVQSNEQIDHLSYKVAREGRDRVVQVSHGGENMWFLLRPASPADSADAQPPSTPWRIASSVSQLGSAHGVAPAASTLVQATPAPPRAGSRVAPHPGVATGTARATDRAFASRSAG